MNAPKPKKAAWPIEIWPVKPTTMLRPSAAMAKMPIWMSRLRLYSFRTCGAKQISTMPAIIAFRLVVVGNTVVSAA